jgi:hypothetical protein
MQWYGSARQSLSEAGQYNAPQTPLPPCRSTLIRSAAFGRYCYAYVIAAHLDHEAELLVTAFAGTSLRGELDRIPLWRGNHVAIKQLAEDFARYIYLPRLADPAVLSSAIQDGLGLLTWEKESFAYADDFDEKAGRYRGLRHGKIDSLSPGALIGLLVRPEIAKTVSVDPPGAYGTTMRTGWAGQP